MTRVHRTGLMLAVAIAAAGPTSYRGPIRAQEQHPGEYSAADIGNGARIYASQCVTCHSFMGDGVGGIDLRRGIFRRVASDDDLRRVIATGVPSLMPKFDLSPAEQNGLVAFIRAGFDVQGRAAKVGDPARGKAVFDNSQCANCHRVSGVGPRSGPDLTDIGLLRTASMIQQSIFDPTPDLLPINRPVRAVTKDGRTISGRRLNEDTYSVQLIDSQGRLMSLLKADLKEYTVATTALMPAYRDKLTLDEIADLVAYLLSLKG